MEITDPSVHLMRQGPLLGASSERDTLNTGQNGGFQAINIALLAGAARIVLLGFDMRFRDGRSHWHKGHPVFVREQAYISWAKHFASLVEPARELGCEILNATPGSAISCFPFVKLSEALRV